MGGVRPRRFVTFIGAGPGDPGLLAVRAREALAEAQVVVADAEVPSAVLESAPEEAECVRVADDGRGVPRRAVAGLLRAHAADGRRVVRLVAGDGGAFHDEAATLDVWGLEFDVVPGVASGTAEAWLRRRPLHGRRVLVTRPRPQAGRLATMLQAYGAEVVTLPTIRIEPPEDWTPLDAAIRGLGTYRWVVFTSVNGVVAFRERLARAGLDARSLAGRQVAAIGPETAAALRQAGIEPDLVPAEFRAEGLLEALATRLGRGDAVLLVRAAEAREVLPRALEARGIRVTVAPAYRTVLVKEGADHAVALLESRRLDAVTFTSSSTVRGLLALLGPADARRLLDGVIVAAIGPITAETATEHGLRVSVMPSEYTVPALADAIAAHFETSPPVTLRG
jgi:uroporphyrinogen-III synthase